MGDDQEHHRGPLCRRPTLETVFTSKSGRPMKMASSGKVIKELFA